MFVPGIRDFVRKRTLHALDTIFAEKTLKASQSLKEQ
jgi:hypothetical protein